MWSRGVSLLLHRFAFAVPGLKSNVWSVLGLTTAKKIKPGRFFTQTEAFEIRKVQSHGERLIAKCAIEPRHSIHSLRRQFSALRELNCLLGDELEHTIPRVVSLEEEVGVLLTTFIPGIPLTSLLRWRANVIASTWSRNYFRKVGHSVGQWLRKFHTATGFDSHVHDHAGFMNELDKNLSHCSDLGFFKAVLPTVRDRAEQLSAALRSSLVRTAGSHGEFLPQNILIRGTDVGVIDFETYRSAAPVYRDLAAFLAYLKTLEGKGKYSRKSLRELASAFREGYGNYISVPQLHLHMINVILEIVHDREPGEHRSDESLLQALNEVLDGGLLEDRRHSEYSIAPSG